MRKLLVRKNKDKKYVAAITTIELGFNSGYINCASADF